MKSLRKQAIKRSMKRHALKMMVQYYANEHALAVAGISTLSQVREIEILNTLASYGVIVDKHFYDKANFMDEAGWFKHLVDFL